MARRNRTDFERDDDPIASLLLEGPAPTPALAPQPLRTPLYDVFTDIEDRRTFHPDGHFRPALDLSGTPAPARLRDHPSRTARYQFTPVDPIGGPVLVCVRRKQRREVIFAKRKAGKGARSRRRRNYWSNVKC